MSYGAPQCDIKIIYDDGSWQPILPGYLIDDDESETLASDIEDARLNDIPGGYYFAHPDYGIVLAANLDSIRIEVDQFGGRVILN